MPWAISSPPAVSLEHDVHAGIDVEIAVVDEAHPPGAEVAGDDLSHGRGAAGVVDMDRDAEPPVVDPHVLAVATGGLVGFGVEPVE